MTQSVPVIVESVKSYDEFPMTRCNYLSIEAEEPMPDWGLGIDGKHIPIMLLAMQAIIVQPLNGEYFENSEQIEALISLIENGANSFSVQVDDLWLPNFLFQWTTDAEHGNEVYRLDSNLFSLAYRFRGGNLSQAKFMNQAREMKSLISYSELEHSAFRNWHHGVIEEARNMYQERAKEDPAMVLQYVSTGVEPKP